MSISEVLIRVGIANADGSPVNFATLVPNANQLALGLRAEFYDTNAGARVFYIINSTETGFDPVAVTSSRIDPGSYLGRVSTMRASSIARSLLASYRARIVTAGDTLSVGELSTLEEALERLIHSSAFAKLKELWVPCGTSAITGAMVKLIGATNMTPHNLVAGDFTNYTGVKGNAANKYIDTGFNPTGVVTATDWGFGVYTTNAAGATQDGCLAGSASDAGNYVSFTGSCKLNNYQPVPFGSNAGASGPDNGLNAVQITGGRVQGWFGGYEKGDGDATGGGGALMNANLVLMQVNNILFTSQTLGGYAVWSPGLTAAEMRELAVFFSSVSIGLQRPGFAPTLGTAGDSIAIGSTLGSPTTQRYTALLAALLGMTEDNQSTSGWAMSHVATVNGANGDWNTQRAYTLSTRAASLNIVALGTNDVLFNTPVATFAKDCETYLLNQFATGIDPSQMILLDLPASPSLDKTRSAALNAAIQGLAAKYGCLLVRASVATTPGVTGTNFTDGLHPNVLGHQQIFNAIVAAISASKYGGVVRRLAW